MNITKKSQSKRPDQLFKLPQDSIGQEKVRVSDEKFAEFERRVMEADKKGKWKKV
tara:strand:+ start:333 stop:497 length:165 start_codon:yes stop_codon:yes gene_type:complete